MRQRLQDQVKRRIGIQLGGAYTQIIQTGIRPIQTVISANILSTLIIDPFYLGHCLFRVQALIFLQTFDPHAASGCHAYIQRISVIAQDGKSAPANDNEIVALGQPADDAVDQLHDLAIALVVTL